MTIISRKNRGIWTLRIRLNPTQARKMAVPTRMGQTNQPTMSGFLV